MTRATDLLDAAPARVRNCVTHHGCDCREYVMARLPAYEAAVEALERLVAFDTDPGELDALEEARAVLARLSDGVPLATGAKR